MHDLAFLDFETTGCDPLVHEIVEAGVIRADGRTLRVLDEVSVRVQPLRIDLAEPDALKVNGYAEPWGGIELRPALQKIAPLLDGATVAGQNVARFDVPFLEAGCRKTGVAILRSKYALDVASLCWPLLIRGQIESLSLRALCDYYGISNVGAHGALVDCRRALEVTRRALGMGPPCKCQWEIGDSPCPRHGDTECPTCGEMFVQAQGHKCAKTKPELAKVDVVRFEKKEGGAA